MKLYLSGGGSGNQSELLDKKFSEELDKSKQLLYIPIAINQKKHPYDKCLSWLRGTFDKLGVKNYIMWDEKDIYLHQKEKPSNFSGIYIGGGNTPYLLKTLKDTGFWKFLNSAVNQNLPIYGGSAGAVIFAKTIIPSLSGDNNFVGITKFSAMNKVKNYDIWCHYELSEDAAVNNFMKENKLKKMIALPEETGLIVDNKIIVLGKKSAFIFTKNEKKEIKSGEELK